MGCNRKAVEPLIFYTVCTFINPGLLLNPHTYDIMNVNILCFGDVFPKQLCCSRSKIYICI